MLLSENRILFVYVNTQGYSLWDRKEYILNRPQFDKYYDKEFLESIIERKKPLEENILYTVGNVGGEFIAQNISTPSKVIAEPINIDILKKEIEEFKPSHIGFSVNLSAFELFKEYSSYIRQNYPQIKIVAGDVGALVPEISQYADYICRGEGVQFVRKLFNENLDKPIQIPRTQVIRFSPNPLKPNEYIPNKFGALTTDLGCGLGCDFCITFALYKRNYIIGNALEIKKALIDIGNSICSETKSNDISIILTDPLAFKDEKLWLDVINLMHGENFCFHFNILTSSSLLTKYTQPGHLLDAFQKSEEMEISLVEMGLESLTEIYAKNRNINWKELIHKLKDSGIVPALSMIIGYDYHTRKTALEEVMTAISFDPAMLHTVNLRILYETQLWYKYQAEKRLLDVPPEFRMLWGYQAFYHPHFEPQFKDCLPLMLEVNDIISSNLGSIYENFTPIIEKRKMTPYNKKLYSIGIAISNLKRKSQKRQS
jgi:hypothetical protein